MFRSTNAFVRVRTLARPISTPTLSPSAPIPSKLATRSPVRFNFARSWSDAAKPEDPLPPHFNAPAKSGDYTMPHPIWTKDQVDGVAITHENPRGFVDTLAYYSVQTLRVMFDFFSGYGSVMNETKWLRRIAFLETVAGVPGMMGAMVRHLSSLRRLGRDHGWIHTLLEDAENERMHLLVAMEIIKPGYMFRLLVLVAQGIFSNFFFIMYLLSPHYCHRFVGYLEEEAVKTYTRLLKDIEAGGPMSHWKSTPAPPIAINYWKLAPNATMEDVIFAIRADESHHRIVNHTLAGLKSNDANPFLPGKSH